MKISNDEIKNELDAKTISFVSFWFIIPFLVLSSIGLFYMIWQNSKNATDNSSVNTSSEDGQVLGTSTNSVSYLIDLSDRLKNNGFVLYGYNGDSATKKQLAVFGQAAENINYVECNSQTAFSNADECVAKGVEKYPTWIVGEKTFVGNKTLTELEAILLKK